MKHVLLFNVHLSLFIARSFGITLWEVMSFGHKPYSQLSNEEVMQSVIYHKTSQLANPLEPGQQPQER